MLNDEVDHKELDSEDQSHEMAAGGEEETTEQSLQKEYAQLKEDLLRALAEAENIRKRTQKEKMDTLKYAISSFGKDLVNVAENLRRALESAPENGDGANQEALNSFVEGVKLTEKELLSVFERHGIKQILPLGEKFDHNFHQAMFEVEDETHPAGTVVQVMEGGYTLHDRLLKPAFVGVSKTTKTTH